MKVMLVGYGKMGRRLEERLLEKGHQVLALVDPCFRDPGFLGDKRLLERNSVRYSSLKEAVKGREGESLKDADAVIEFTQPDAAVDNLLFLINEKVPVVTGTTGWNDKLPEIEKAVETAGSSLVWSPNFSLGVNLFIRIAAYSAKLADLFAEYDVAGFETHHNQKADSPSGTAKTLVERVLAQMTRKKKAVYGTLERKPEADELHYASLRLGSVPGTHNLLFDSHADTIEITHTARSREGFAAGTVLAAQWLVDKKRTGVFTMDDVLADLLP